MRTSHWNSVGQYPWKEIESYLGSKNSMPSLHQAAQTEFRQLICGISRSERSWRSDVLLSNGGPQIYLTFPPKGSFEHNVKYMLDKTARKQYTSVLITDGKFNEYYIPVIDFSLKLGNISVRKTKLSHKFIEQCTAMSDPFLDINWQWKTSFNFWTRSYANGCKGAPE